MSRRRHIIASVLIVGHLLAIVTAATSVTNGTFGPPPICSKLHGLLSPYLQSLVLDSSYRFFAPRPSVGPKFWLRLYYQSGRTRCLEWPSRGEPTSRGVYWRDMLLASAVGETNPEESGEADLPSIQDAMLSSYARHIANHASFLNNDPRDSIIKVDFYVAAHELLSPEQVRQRWSAYDLRLYQATSLGSFTNTGCRLGARVITPIPISTLATAIIENDIQPAIDPDGGPGALHEYFAREGTPQTIRHLLLDNPELLKSRQAELVTRVEQVLFAQTGSRDQS